MQAEASVLSQRFLDKVLLMPEGFLQPRQGRNSVAQGEALGKVAPTPLFFPLPRSAGEGDGGRGSHSGSRLVGTKLCRPSADGLTSLASL